MLRFIPALLMVTGCVPGSGELLPGGSEGTGGEDTPSIELESSFDTERFDYDALVITNLRAIDDFSTLVTALERAELADALLPENVPTNMGWTIFAPTNTAFEAAGIDPDDFETAEELEALREVLLYHITWGGPYGLDIHTFSPCEPYAGQPLYMASGEYAVEGDYTSWTDTVELANDCAGTVRANQALVIGLDSRVGDAMIQVVNQVL